MSLGILMHEGTEAFGAYEDARQHHMWQNFRKKTIDEKAVGNEFCFLSIHL